MSQITRRNFFVSTLGAMLGVVLWPWRLLFGSIQTAEPDLILYPQEFVLNQQRTPRLGALARLSIDERDRLAQVWSEEYDEMLFKSLCGEQNVSN